MKMSATMLAAAVLAAGSMLPAAYGADDPLDLGLGPKQGPMPAEVKKADVAAPKSDAATPKKEEKKPVVGEMISPNATKAVDDQELINKLTGVEKPGDKIKEVIDHMGQSETRLKEKDPGEITQETQRRIVMDLDVLIDLAKKQQSSSSSQQQQQQQGQEKQLSQGNKQGSQSQGGDQAAQKSVLPNGAAVAPQSNGTNIVEKSQEWGGLPARDRDLISHGANEQYLPAYKEQIDKYYQALAEIGKAAKDR